MIDCFRRSPSFIVRFIAVSTVTLLCWSAAAARVSGVWGIVRAESSTVYSAPNFDASEVATLPAKTRVVMSRTTFGQTGPQFYKVKFQINGHWAMGYVLDSEIGPEKAGTVAPPKTRRPELAGKSGSKKPSKIAGNPSTPPTSKRARKRKRPQQPMLFSNYVGVVGGFANYKEKISGVNAEQSLPVYGIKITGPELLLKGPIMDINILLHMGAPSYYNSLSGIKPAGFILWTDALLMYPFFNHDNSLIYFEFGPLLVLSDFKVLNNDRLMDLFSLAGGLSSGFGGAVRLGTVALRLDAKYLIENKSYLSFLASIQSEF